MSARIALIALLALQLAGARRVKGELPVPRVEFVEVEELSDTERGTGGFGSTGTL